MMDKNFMQYVYARCEEALINNEQYMKMERDKETDPNALQAIAEEACYIQGYQDGLRIAMSMLKIA